MMKTQSVKTALVMLIGVAPGSLALAQDGPCSPQKGLYTPACVLEVQQSYFNRGRQMGYEEACTNVGYQFSLTAEGELTCRLGEGLDVIPVPVGGIAGLGGNINSVVLDDGRELLLDTNKNEAFLLSQSAAESLKDTGALEISEELKSAIEAGQVQRLELNARKGNTR